jgi:hypothetical protein
MPPTKDRSKLKTRRHPIRWIGNGPAKNFARIPNDLCRDRISTRARSVAMYLWSQRDGWELAPTSIHAELGMDHKTATKALEELSDRRWLAIHKTGDRSREYFAHPSRRLTEAEHDSLTRYGEKIPLTQQQDTPLTGESPKANGTKSRYEAPVNGSKSPTKKTKLLEDYKKTKDSSLDDDEKKARKTKLQQRVRDLIPEHRNRAHLMNIAVKSMLTDSVPFRAIKTALEEWHSDDHTDPWSLRDLIHSAMANDVPAIIERLLASQDDKINVSSLQRFGHYFQPPEPPAIRDITVEQARAFANKAKRAWLQDLLETELNKHETVDA